MVRHDFIDFPPDSREWRRVGMFTRVLNFIESDEVMEETVTVWILPSPAGPILAMRWGWRANECAVHPLDALDPVSRNHPLSTWSLALNALREHPDLEMWARLA